MTFEALADDIVDRIIEHVYYDECSFDRAHAKRQVLEALAQQAQPDEPTREMIDAAYAQYCRGTGMDRDDFEDAVRTLFHKNS